MMLHGITKRRPNNLEKLYAALKTIKPTPVAAERAFSAIGYFVSKIRNCLNSFTAGLLSTSSAIKGFIQELSNI